MAQQQMMLPRVPSDIMVDEATTKLAANQPSHVQVHHDATAPVPTTNGTMVMPLSLMDIKRNTVPLRTASSGSEKKHSANQMAVAVGHEYGSTIGASGGDTSDDDDKGVQDRDRMFPMTRDGVSQLMMTSSNRDVRWSLGRLASSVNGLAAPEAAERLFKLGPNALVNLKLDKWYHHLGRAFAHPFNMLLLVLAAIGGATGDFKSLVVLTIMVVVSVITRFSQELKSSIAANDLRKRVTQLVHVRRPLVITPDSVAVDLTHNAHIKAMSPALPYEVITVPFESIVPGDVVELAAGSMIPGDVRILQSDNALVSQSVLTGESIPVEKVAAAHNSKALAPPSDSSSGAPVPAAAAEDTKGDYLRRTNLSFMGSNVSAGSMVCMVMVTGNRTYFGANAAQLVHARPPSSFAIGVRKISYLLMGFMVVMMPLIVIINGATTGEWTDAVLFGIAVAVGLTPEMLPMIVNGNLAIGASRMAEEKCIIKRLEAIQNIGAMTVLCTDKTGTLTADQVQVHTSIDINGTASNLPLAVGFAISRFQKGLRNVMDESILRSGEADESLVKLTTAYTKRGELPFDFVRRCMSVVIDGIALPTPNNEHASSMLLCKGAFDEIVAKCTHFVAEAVPSTAVEGVATPTMSSVAAIGEIERKKLHDLSVSLPSAGLRIIAVAYRAMGPLSAYGRTDDGAVRITKADEANLTLVGFLTFMDPPKPDAAATLAKIASLGVQVKVLSGDNPLVANMVCNQLGLNASAGHTLTGDELFELTADDEDPELRAIFARTVVFSRLNPSQKARVVGVLRDMGNTVGFLGDGINDTLALREADVGISVDTGSDLAKDAADVILTEKNLSVIHSAIVTGRRTHGNTVKYIYMAASSNFGNVFSLLVAAAWLPFIPMRPLHLLAQNLLYDFSQIAIPFDNVDEAYIRTPKQWAIGSLSSFMLCIGPISSIFDVTTFCIAWWYYGYDNVDEAQRFQTCWFLVGIMTQLTIVHAIRSDQPFFGHGDVKGSRASWHVWFASFLLGAIALILPNVSGSADLLSFTPPPANFYGFMAMILVVYVGLTQVVKQFYIRHFKRWL